MMLPASAIIFGLFLAGVAFADPQDDYDDDLQPFDPVPVVNITGEFGASVGSLEHQPRSALDRQAVSVPCGDSELIGPGAVFRVESPRYPRWYPSRKTCTQTFGVVPGTKLTVECDVFRTKGWRSCRRGDRVEMTFNNGIPRERFCGRMLDNKSKVLVFDPETQAYSVVWKFTSDRRRRDKGFSCTFIGEGDGSVDPTGPGTTPAPTSGPVNPDCNCGIANTANRIVNGVATEENEYPWQVLFHAEDSMGRVGMCGGTILNNRFVMTAAHCTDGGNPGRMSVKVGEHNRNQNVNGERWIKVKRVHQHEDYNKAADVDMDFAILELDEELTWTDKIRPACIPENDSNDYVGADATVSGWGATSQGGNTANKLQEVEVKVLANNKCMQQPYGYGRGDITANMMCASAPSKDSCQGDSGGPLVTEINGRYTLIGVVSWGYGCAQPQYPGVYARMTRVLPWIESTISSGNTCYPNQIAG